MVIREHAVVIDLGYKLYSVWGKFRYKVGIAILGEDDGFEWQNHRVLVEVDDFWHRSKLNANHVYGVNVRLFDSSYLKWMSNWGLCAIEYFNFLEEVLDLFFPHFIQLHLGF